MLNNIVQRKVRRLKDKIKPYSFYKSLHTPSYQYKSQLYFGTKTPISAMNVVDRQVVNDNVGSSVSNPSDWCIPEVPADLWITARCWHHCHQSYRLLPTVSPTCTCAAGATAVTLKGEHPKTNQEVKPVKVGEHRRVTEKESWKTPSVTQPLFGFH